jgi:hypothetical protein
MVVANATSTIQEPSIHVSQPSLRFPLVRYFFFLFLHVHGIIIMYIPKSEGVPVNLHSIFSLGRRGVPFIHTSASFFYAYSNSSGLLRLTESSLAVTDGGVLTSNMIRHQTFTFAIPGVFILAPDAYSHVIGQQPQPSFSAHAQCESPSKDDGSCALQYT